MRRYIFTIALFLMPGGAFAQDCLITDESCVFNAMLQESVKIENVSWRDQTYREIAKTMAAERQYDKAIALISKIETPDTKAMTIRGIGMAVADHKLSQEDLDSLFAKLRAEAEKIDHPPSYAIALTYIAMGQAFAGDNEGAWKTASDMENDALRHKAYGETAEIQAEKGDDTAAMKSISMIDVQSYRNKAYATVSKILADRGLLQQAYNAALPIENSYKKAQAMQYVMDVKNNPKKAEEKQK